MTRTDWFIPKWRWLKRFSALAIIGIVLAILGWSLQVVGLAGLGFLLVVPLVFWLALIPVLHWKERYIGGRSTAWGAFLVFEASSWSKLVYWFVHVLPDWRQTKQYAGAP